MGYGRSRGWTDSLAFLDSLRGLFGRDGALLRRGLFVRGCLVRMDPDRGGVIRRCIRCIRWLASRFW